MATAFKCDRCKRLLEGTREGIVTYTRKLINMSCDEITKELCEECNTRIVNFIEDASLVGRKKD